MASRRAAHPRPCLTVLPPGLRELEDANGARQFVATAWPPPSTGRHRPFLHGRLIARWAKGTMKPVEATADQHLFPVVEGISGQGPPR